MNHAAITEASNALVKANKKVDNATNNAAKTIASATARATKRAQGKIDAAKAAVTVAEQELTAAVSGK